MDTPQSNDRPDFTSVMDGLQSGQISLTNEPYSEPVSSDPEPEAPETEASAEKSTTEELREFMDSKDDTQEEESEEELSASESDKEEDSEADSKESAEDIEAVRVTDAKGRREVKVDFSDREKLKKYVQLAYGGRKWQQERDSARTELTQLQEKYNSLEKDWQKVEDSFKSSGVAGLVNLLEGKEDAFDGWYEKEQARREAWAGMSDSERQSYQREEEARRQELKAKELEEKYEAKLAEIETERERADQRALEAKLHPSFDRYRFSGKLGDEVAEHHYDQALWNQALSNLEELPEDIEITPAMVDKEFRKVSSAFKKAWS